MYDLFCPLFELLTENKGRKKVEEAYRDKGRISTAPSPKAPHPIQERNLLEVAPLLPPAPPE